MTMAKKVLSEEEIMKQIEEQRIKLLMDNMVEKIKEQQEQINQINQLAQLKIMQIEEIAAQKAKGYEDEIERMKLSLMALYEKVPKAETKTQCKVTLLSGDVVVKKPVVKFDYDKQLLLDQALELGLCEFVKTKTVVDFDWASYKETLQITEQEEEGEIVYKILDITTGEIIDNAKGLSIKIEPERVVIQ